jgi:starch synthase
MQVMPVEWPTLGEAIRRTIELYGQTDTWARMQRKGMKTDVSWEKSAGKYAALYNKLLGIE